MKILLVNGPNLNLLGNRETDIYGKLTLDDIEQLVTARAKSLGYSLQSYQSNSEGELIDFIQKNSDADGLLINPGAYSHYSYALHDCLRAVGFPAVEVHLSNIFSRENFRHKSVVAPVCIGTISGFGVDSYLLGLAGLHRYLTEEEE